MRDSMLFLLLSALVLSTPASAAEEDAPVGYYRFPAIHGETVIFTAEGDLWTVPAAGGRARRLTTHPGQEGYGAISPDGRWLAFSAEYEGPTEVYVMPLAGGLPKRLTYHGSRARVEGWTPDGQVLYATRHFSTLPSEQLVRVDPASGELRRIPLAQAAEGVFERAGGSLFFTRPRFQGSHAKRYRGGTAQKIWRFDGEGREAVPLTADYPGTSRAPMPWGERVVFASDRDGSMNLWSMDRNGGDLRQHTRHAGWDAKSPSIHDGRVVYQLGADLYLLDLATGETRRLAVTLASDLDQRRETWIEEPMSYLTSAHLSPKGKKVVLTARGQVFVEPVGEGRRVEVGRAEGVRYRSARFLDEETLVALSDESGEVEWWRLPARGVGEAEQLTHDAEVLRFDGLPSPDGRWIAYLDQAQSLWLLDLTTGGNERLAISPYFGFGELAFSPDSRWLAYVMPEESFMRRIWLREVATGRTFPLTSERFDSHAPAWDPAGKWIYFLSDRHLESLTRAPWGPYQPGPFLDSKTKIYQIALVEGPRSPFAPRTELQEQEESGGGGKSEASGEGKENGAAKAGEKEPPRVEIDEGGLRRRLEEVPVAPGTYQKLAVGGGHLYWLSRASRRGAEPALTALEIGRETEPKTVAEGVRAFELSADGERLLLRKAKAIHVIEAGGAAPKKLAESRLELDDWSFPIDPREEWRQMYLEAWRLHRDYFYDPGMHGVDWPAMREKYLPLVERVTDRAELSDLLAQLISEVSALHARVRGGDLREGPEDVATAHLGALTERDEAAGGHRVLALYGGEPALPEERSPLARPGSEVRVGEVITAVDGRPAAGVAELAALIRGRAGEQVLLEVRDAEGAAREVIVEPITSRELAELRYRSWQHERRLRVEELGGGRLGYVHLRAMGGGNWAEWARGYFPVFRRQGLVVDVRHNSGGNIDSWILGSLIRKTWMWWKPRVGEEYGNMQYAFDGHLVVLVDEFTASDGEAFAEGFRRLGLGPVIGTRTWGGEIWLTSSNVLVDRGIATAAEFGVYGPEGEWLIEGHGVEPDLVVDNPPHATFRGEDAQLEKAVEILLERIREQPVSVPPAPPYPDKSFSSGGS